MTSDRVPMMPMIASVFSKLWEASNVLDCAVLSVAEMEIAAAVADAPDLAGRYHIGRHVVGQGDATVAAGGLQVIVDYAGIQI